MPILAHGRVESQGDQFSVCIVGWVRGQVSWVMDRNSRYTGKYCRVERLAGTRPGQHCTTTGEHASLMVGSHLHQERAPTLLRNTGRHCTHHFLNGPYILKLSKASDIEKNLYMETK